MMYFSIEISVQFFVGWIFIGSKGSVSGSIGSLKMTQMDFPILSSQCLMTLAPMNTVSDSAVVFFLIFMFALKIT